MKNAHNEDQEEAYGRRLENDFVDQLKVSTA